MRKLLSTTLVLTALAAPTKGQDYSIDPPSPETALVFPPLVPWYAGDIVHTLGVRTLVFDGSVIPYWGLGLSSNFDNVDAFSYGHDELQPLGSTNHVYFSYSVDRTTVGAPGSAIALEAAGNGAAGDKFGLDIRANGVIISPARLLSDAPLHSLTPLPAVQADIDGLSVPASPVRIVGRVPGDERAVYFSIDSATALNYPTFGPADILVQPTAAWRRSAISIYANRAALGLVAGDDIDALAVDDIGVLGVFDPGDIVYVSLTPGSPSLATLGVSPASIIQVSPGPPVEFATPANLGLLATDNLDAMTGFDPGMECETPPPFDCNLNCIPDELENDFDGDGQTDDCDVDIDGDGVANEEDLCDHTPPGVPVNSVGQPLGDTNGDCTLNGTDIQIFVSLLLT